MALVNATDVLSPDSPASPVTIGATSAGTVYTPPNYIDPGPVGGGAIAPGAEHNGITISADSANTGTAYLLLGTGTPSAANWHIALPAGQFWDGTVGGCVYRGPVKCWNGAAAGINLGVAIV